MTLGETLSKRDQEALIRYVRICAVVQHPRDSPREFMINLEREAICLCNGAAMVDDPDAKKPEAAGIYMGQLMLRARDADPEAWEAIARNALRLFQTGERPSRWTVHP